MAKIDYVAITRAMRDQLAADADVIRLDARIGIHEPVPTDLTRNPFVGIYESRRTSPPLQDLAAGTRTRYEIQWEIQVHCFSSDSDGAYEDAASRRDELLGAVEVALMRDRTLGGVLADNSLMLRGGELGGVAQSVGFISSGQLLVTAEATISA